MTTVACVLRSGGDYGVQHVERLAGQVRRHAPEGTEVTCLTDMLGVSAVPGVRAVALQHDWPGWWSKVEVLRLPGPLLYLDLDVSVVGDLAPLLDVAADRDFVMIRSLWGPGDPNKFNSSVMAWRAAAPRHLHDLFASNPAGHIEQHSKLPEHRATWGDQGFIFANFRGAIAAWQDHLPGAVMSFKRGALMGADLSHCAVLCSHGTPRPWHSNGADAWLSRRQGVDQRGRRT